MSSEKKWTDFTSADDLIKSIEPGFTGEAHPDTFSVAAMPVITEQKPGQLPEEKIRKFFEDGYLVVEDFFTEEEMEAVKESVKDLVEMLAQKLYRTGRIKNLYEDSGFYERLTKLEREFPGAEILLIKFGILTKAFKDLWSNERLLNVVEQLIGPDIAGNPVWGLRPKTPQSDVMTVAWHQDSGYMDNSIYKSMLVTAWIPLLDTNEENGCMQFACKGHRKGMVARHSCCAGQTWHALLKEEEMEKTLGVDLEKDVKLCPVPYRGLVFFNSMIPHRSLLNRSDMVRWSFDFRFQSASTPSGFFGLGETVLMRTSKDPNYQIKWDKLDGGNSKKDKEENEQYNEEEFDTTVQGPWMVKWDLLQTNRHTVKMEKKLEALRAKENLNFDLSPSIGV